MCVSQNILQIIVNWISKHFKIYFVDIIEFLDTLFVNISKISQADEFVILSACLVAAVGPGEIWRAGVEISGSYYVLNVFLHCLKQANHIVPVDNILF